MAEVLASPWLGTTEGAKYAKRHPKTLLRALRQGELRGFQSKKPNGTWRIHIDDIDAWVRGEKPKVTRRAS
jgi:hypothetical protein